MGIACEYQKMKKLINYSILRDKFDDRTIQSSRNNQDLDI